MLGRSARAGRSALWRAGRPLPSVTQTRAWRRPGLKGVQGMYGMYVVFPEVPDAESVMEGDVETLRLTCPDTGLPAFDTDVEDALNEATRAATAYDIYSANLGWSLKEPGQEVTFANTLGDREAKKALAMAAWGVARQLLVSSQPDDPTPDRLTLLKEDAAKVEDMITTSETMALASDPMLTGVRELSESSGLSPPQRRLVQRWFEEADQWGRRQSAEKRDVSDHLWGLLKHQTAKYTLNIAASFPKYDAIIQDPNELVEAPEETVRALARSEDPYEGPWHVPIHPTFAHKYLLYGGSPHRRASVWQAVNVRAGFRDYITNNSVQVEEIRFMAFDAANAMGFDSYAHLRHQTTMAGSVDNAQEFLDSLKAGLVQRWTTLYQDLNAFTHRDMAVPAQRMRPHDIYYHSRRLAQSRHQLSSAKPLRDYFPARAVWDNLLDYASELFGLEFSELPQGTFPAYHDTLRAFEVLDQDSGRVIGHLYWDPFARRDKFHSPRCSLVRPRCDAVEMTPAVVISTALCGSDSPPLHWDELTELLWLFGDALRQLLTESPFPSLGGDVTAEMDTREAVPGFFAGLAHHPASLVRLSEGGSLSLADAATASHCFMEVGLYGAMRRAFLGAFDQRCYVHMRPFWRDVYIKLWEEHFPGMSMWQEDVLPCTFTPIFSGPWRATYYGKLWAQMLSHDILQRLAEETEAGRAQDFGRKFRDEMLCWGPMKPFHVQFESLMGRQPSLTPLVDFYELPRPDEPAQALDGEEKRQIPS